MIKKLLYLSAVVPFLFLLLLSQNNTAFAKGTPRPSQTPTLSPTMTPSPTVVPTATPTPTQTPTMTSSPTPTGPVTFVGLGILGDSMSDEYKADDNRGGAYSATTLNWDEQLVAFRGLNIGSWGQRSEPRRSGYEYNWSRSGARVSDLLSQGQATGLANQISNGLVSHVYIMVGFNDFAAWNQTYDQIYNGKLTSTGIQTKLNTILSNMTTILNTLENAGQVEVVIGTVIDKSPSTNFRNRYPDPVKRQKVTDAINTLNTGLINLAASRGNVIYDVNSDYANLWTRTDQNGNIAVGNDFINTLVNADEPHHFILGDNGHEGTVISGMIANGLVNTLNTHFNLGLAPFTESELLINAGIAQ